MMSFEEISILRYIMQLHVVQQLPLFPIPKTQSAAEQDTIIPLIFFIVSGDFRRMYGYTH